MPTRSSGCTTAWSGGAVGAQTLRVLRAAGRVERQRPGPRRLAHPPSTSTRASRYWSLTSTCTSTGRGKRPAVPAHPAPPAAARWRCLNHAAYESIKTDLQRTAATYGYLDARLIRAELSSTRRTQGEPSARARHRPALLLRSDSIRQDAVREPLVRRYLRYHEGEPFDLTQVLRTSSPSMTRCTFPTSRCCPGS